MNVLKKLQNLPEQRKKLILWAVVMVIALPLFIWRINNFKEKIKNFEMEKFKEELKIPSFEKELKNFPLMSDEKEQ